MTIVTALGTRAGFPCSVICKDSPVCCANDTVDQLRRRLIRSALAIAVGVLVGFAFINPAIDFLLRPTRRALPSGTRLIYTQPGEAFGLYIQVALILG